MILARTGDIVFGTCICNSIYPFNPYPISGVIGVGDTSFLLGGIPIAVGLKTMVNFICTSGPQTGFIIPSHTSSTGLMPWARLTDSVMGICVVGALITSTSSGTISL